MASRGGTGITMELDWVPQRAADMTAYELLLSESQERMLLVIRPGSEEEARNIFEKWQIDFEIIGKITDTGRMVLKNQGSVVGDIPIKPLVDDAPMYERQNTRRDPVGFRKKAFFKRGYVERQFTS